MAFHIKFAPEQEESENQNFELEEVSIISFPICIDDDCSNDEFHSEGIDIHEVPSEYFKSNISKRYLIGCLEGVPDAKTEICYEKIWGVKVPYPCIYTRECKKCFYLDIKIGNASGSVESHLKECATVSVAAALPFVLAGQFNLAIAAAKEAFKLCMVAKIGDITFELGIFETKSCSKWDR